MMSWEELGQKLEQLFQQESQGVKPSVTLIADSTYWMRFALRELPFDVVGKLSDILHRVDHLHRTEHLSTSYTEWLKGQVQRLFEEYCASNGLVEQILRSAPPESKLIH